MDLTIKKPSSICFKEVEQFCSLLNAKCKLSTTSFYPTGGLLYHYYSDIFQFELPTDTDCATNKPMFSTPDIDGYFMILPHKINVKNIRQTNALMTYNIALEAVNEMLQVVNKQSQLYDDIEGLKISLQYEIQTKKDNKLPTEEYGDILEFQQYASRLCKFDVYIDVVKKPIFSIKDLTFEKMNGLFFGSDGTELVLHRWTTVPNYKNVFIVHPYAHLFDQLYTLFDRSNTFYTNKLKQVENNTISEMSKNVVIRQGRLKMQKTAFRIKVFCNAVFPGLTINKLFQYMQNEHFEGILQFDLLHQKNLLSEKQLLPEKIPSFLETYGNQTIETFCDNVLVQVNVVCEKLRKIYTSLILLKF